MSTILLFGGGLQSLSIARGLSENGHRVINMSDNRSVGKFSRFIDTFICINLDGLLPDVVEVLLEKNGVDVIIPLEDEYTEWLSTYKDEIEEKIGCKVASPDINLFKKVINKLSLLDFCREKNIPHPITIPIDTRPLESSFRDFKFPALIKPNVSNGSRGICKVENYDELVAKATDIASEFGSCTLQEYIENDHYYNVMLYRYQDGSFGPRVATKIRRYYPVKGGSSSFCTTISDDRLFNICEKLLDKLEWYGFADFDVLEKENGDYRIIEINPRIPASVHAAYASGVDFGCVIVEDMLFSRKVEMSYTPGENLRCLGLDIAWFISSPKRFKTNPNWFNFFGKHLHYQEGGLKDWKAMIYSIYSGIRKQLSPSFRKAKSGMN